MVSNSNERLRENKYKSEFNNEDLLIKEDNDLTVEEENNESLNHNESIIK